MNKEWSELNKLTKKQDELYHKCALNAGITDTKFWILYAICESGGILCQNSFCENWCYSKQTVNAAVASLEEEGILYLEFAQGSKKQKDLKLTQKGEDFCNRYIRSVLNAECRSVMSLQPEERRRFLSTMEKLLSTLEQELDNTAILRD